VEASEVNLLIGFATYVVPFVIVLSVVVFFHELGHFLVGRWCGVKVDAFSIGFGPELFAREDRYGTRWRLAAIPLGGYVKFHGDANGASAPDPDAIESMPEAERAVTFAAQPVWKRAAIVFAGPFANFVLAIVILTGVFSFYGRTIIAPRVGTVAVGGAGEAAGFKPGDLVVSIDGEPIPSFSKMQEVVSAAAEIKLHFVVRRGDSEVAFDATPAWREVESLTGKVRIGLLGLHAATGRENIHEERYGPVESLGLAFTETWQIVRRTGLYMSGLITGRESADQLSGPIGIAQVSGQMAQAAREVGLAPMLNLIAILSISVGLLNLLPVPLLDGGHLAFFAVEAVRGRALNERAQDLAFRVGLAMVGSLMIFSTYNDIARLIQRLAAHAS
jgi:regulator of sigma E protease